MPPDYVLAVLPLELVPPELVNWLPVQIAGGLTFMAACAWFWRSLLGPVVHRGAAIARLAEQTFEDWQGVPERDGVPARPGVMARLAAYDDRIEGMTLALQESQELAAKHTELLDKIKYHVMPNSGKSAYDKQGEKIDDLAGHVGKLTDSQLAVAGAVDRLREDKERAHDEMLRRIARIEQHNHPEGEESSTSAWYPEAIRKPLETRLENRRRLMPTPVRINLHTAVSNSTSLKGYWDSQGVFSHFYVRKDGTVEQYQDTKYRSACDLDGNPDTISIETWDGASNPTIAWNAAQMASLGRLCRWIFANHPSIPRKIATSNRAGYKSRGMSWHQLGHPGFALYTRAEGGLLYTTSYKKVCPGTLRIRQVPEVFRLSTGGTIPNPTPTPTQQEEDMPLTDTDIARIVTAVRATELTANGRKAGLIDHLATSFVDGKTALQGIAQVSAQVRAVADKVGAQIDVDAVVSGVVAGLLPDLVAAVSQAAGAEGLTDEQAQRIAATVVDRIAGAKVSIDFPEGQA